MTTSPQNSDAESQWQQPPFQPSGQGSEEAPLEGRLVVPESLSAGMLVPRRPPSALESIINVVNGVLWPVLIGMALFGIGGWVGNIVIAIIASSLLGGVSAELKRRRRYLPPPEGDSLR
ncbi:MAG: hypothetical protein IT193_10120 [Propionibacteriaceae bacterium]|nr:hypothetical protein [Propionibacteriaceae bacterium]